MRGQQQSLSRSVCLLQTPMGGVLAEDLVAPTDLPRFDRSAMDGYAVRHEDLIGASQVNPVKLKIVNC